MKTLVYIFKMLLIIFLERIVFVRKIRFENLYVFFKGSLIPGSKVLFYFPDSSLMHLGDQIFFEPILRLFKENNFAVCVIPTSTMRNYFDGLGYDVRTPELLNCDDFDLVISPSRFLRISTIFSKRNKVFVQTVYDRMKSPLIVDMLNKITSLFNLENNVTSKPQLPLSFKKNGKVKSLIQIVKTNSQLVLYSNYINSGRFRLKNSRSDTLYKYCAENLKNHFIIHLGTLEDKYNDDQTYDFVGLDLRGCLTIDELIEFMMGIGSFTFVGFDNVIMHLAFILNADCRIVSRGRWSKQSRRFLANCIDPPFDPIHFSGRKKYIVNP